MKIQLPKSVNDIIDQLIEHGFEAYAVGGCIRDSIIGAKPEDWDITTSAKPIEVKQIFKRTVDTGIKHGTVTILHEGVSYEVTTYRIDGEYEDGRHPSSVEFTSDLAKDLMRRDFTINAMAYNNQDGLVDLYNGIEDLRNRVIRCVGSPINRFEEDALRILRAFRFAAQLNFSIEARTYAAACEKKENLRNISAERIRTELNKLLISHHPEKLIDIYNAGITAIILAEFDSMIESPHMNIEKESKGTYAVKTLGVLDDILKTEKDFASNEKLNLSLRWTLLLHEVDGKNDSIESSKQARKILRRLKFDNETIDNTARLIKWINVPFILTDYGVRKAINKIGEDLMVPLFIVKAAKIRAFPNYRLKETLNHLSKAWDIYIKILERGQCTNLKQLEVDGKDLISIGYKPGKELGKTLNKLLALVLKSPELNRKDILIEKAKEFLS